MSQQANTFIKWLDEQEDKSGFSDYEVAKQGGFSHSVISRARSGIPPKFDVCTKIAKVFNVSPVTVLRKAGLLPEGNENASFEDWQYLLGSALVFHAHNRWHAADRHYKGLSRTQ